MDQNTPGLDAGDVAGFGAEMIVDPLNLAGGGLLAKLLGKASRIAKSNKLSNALRSAGAMPEDVATATKIVDKLGNPRKVYHGTPANLTSARQLSPKYAGVRNDAGWRGKGVYFTPSKMLAESEEYAGEGGKVLSAFIDSRNPYYTEASNPIEFASELNERFGFKSKLDDAFNRGDEVVIDRARQAALSQAATNRLIGLGHDSVVSGLDSEVIPFLQKQIYEPVIAPAIRRPPRVSPLVAILAGHNTLKTTQQPASQETL